MSVTPTTTGVGRDALCVNTIRTLAMDAVQQADSGHPGTPSIKGATAVAFAEDVGARPATYGRHVQRAPPADRGRCR